MRQHVIQLVRRLVETQSIDTIPTAWLKHFQECDECRRALGELVEDMTQQSSLILAEVEACDACRQTLPAYVEASLSGRHQALLYPDVAAHLRSCDACRSSYLELRAMMAPALAWTQVKEGVRSLQQQVVLAVEGARTVFGEMAAPLTAQPVPIGVRGRLRDDDIKEQLLRISDDDQPFDVFLYTSVSAAGEGMLDILVVDTLTGEPISDARVTQESPDSDREFWTNDSGAIQRPLAPGTYHMTVEHGGVSRTFELCFRPGPTDKD